MAKLTSHGEVIPRQRKAYALKIGLSLVGIVALFVSAQAWGFRSIGFSTPIFLAFLTFPLIWQENKRKELDIMPRLPFIMGLFFSLCSILLPLSPLYFLVASLLLCAFYEGVWGRQGMLPYAILFLASPAFAYAVQVFGFPIRLQLSNTAAFLLSFANPEAHSIGNGIYWNGRVFWVDEACVGLSMMGTGGVLSMAIIGYKAKEGGVRIRSWALLLALLLSLLLLVWANLSRLLSIVVLTAPAGSIAHHALGLFSLSLHVLLPIYGMVYYLKDSPVVFYKAEEHTVVEKRSPIMLGAMLLLGLLPLLATGFARSYTPFHGLTEGISSESLPRGLNPEEIKTTQLNGDIWQSRDAKQGLWYWKGPLQPYRSDHSPMVCWKGSGYTLNRIEMHEIRGSSYYQGLLNKENSRMHTAWWYQRADGKRIEAVASQWEWRKAALFGKEYWLVNVTASTEAELNQLIDAALRENSPSQ